MRDSGKAATVAYRQFGPDQVAAREAAIWGCEPRVGPLDRDAVAQEAVDSTMAIRRAALGHCDPLTIDQVPEIVLTMMRHRALWEASSGVSITLYTKGRLPARERELVVLRTTWLCQAPYAWGEHVKQGKSAGLTDEEVDRATRGSDAPGWSEADRALVRAVEELHGDAMIADETWAILAQSLDEAQLYEMTVLVGQFTTVAYFQNAMRLRLAPGNPGLTAR